MPVVQQGTINTAALIVPNLYVQIVPPRIALISGVATNILGVVGTAKWGPINAATVIGDWASYERQFGTLQARKYDMGSQVAAAVLQGANNMACVRVTDGTDTAASVTVQTNCITFTSKYTGSGANGDKVTVGPGSKAGTIKVTVARPGMVPEAFDNIGAGLTGADLWAAIANAINNGQQGQRGSSDLIIATAGAGTTAPATATYTLAGGDDGASTITAATLVGQDSSPRRGMYALRGTGAGVVVLADVDDSTTWTTLGAYGYSEGSYMVVTGPSGDTISAAISRKATAGIDDYPVKVMHGDWIYYNDPVNGLRLLSPQGFAAGRLVNLSPQEGSLNKPIYGIVGTQQTLKGLVYSDAELAQLGNAGIDVITNPSPGGSYFSARFGHNSSSNPAINGDNYTRMTNFIAYSIAKSLGRFVGQLQTPEKRKQAAAALSSFFDNLWQQGMIGTADGSVPYRVVLDDSNNTPTRVALGYMQADVQVTYLSVIEKFIVNLEGGQGVQIQRVSTTAA